MNTIDASADAAAVADVDGELSGRSVFERVRGRRVFVPAKGPAIPRWQTRWVSVVMVVLHSQAARTCAA